MAKAIGNPIEIRVVVQNGDGYPIDQVKACYTMCCEHEINENRMLVLEETELLARTVEALVEEAVDQIEESEGM